MITIINKTIYTCDICKKDFEDPNECLQYGIPGYETDCEGYGNYPTTCQRELCKDCHTKLIKILKDNGIFFKDCPGGHIDEIDLKSR